MNDVDWNEAVPAIRTTPATSSVAIAEDDEIVANLLAAQIESIDCVATIATSGKELLALLERDPVDLVMLDLGLPDEDGLVLARQIKSRAPLLPVIVLTARASDEDRIAALEIGVDDYMLKNVGTRELLLRVRNALDRAGPTGGSGPRNAVSHLRFGDWLLDLDARRLTNSEGAETGLTRGEFDLLAALAKSPNRVRTRSQLLDELSRGSEPPADRMIDAFVSRVRAKMGDRRIITTITGIGYRFNGVVTTR